MALWKTADKSSALRETPKFGNVTSKANPSNSGQDMSGVGQIGAPAATKPNGDGAAPELSPEQLRQMAGASKAVTATFGEIVSLLMRLPQYKHYALSDLEWLVAPALLTSQFSLATAQSKTKGLTAPVGLVLWASVSAELDKRLSAAPGQPIRLQPQEWKSGDMIWVILAAGDERVIQGMLKQLQEKEWADKKPAKIFARAKDGKPTVVTLENKAA